MEWHKFQRQETDKLTMTACSTPPPAKNWVSMLCEAPHTSHCPRTWWRFLNFSWSQVRRFWVDPPWARAGQSPTEAPKGTPGSLGPIWAFFIWLGTLHGPKLCVPFTWDGLVGTGFLLTLKRWGTQLSTPGLDMPDTTLELVLAADLPAWNRDRRALASALWDQAPSSE